MTTQNSIHIIMPYKYNGQWVFDDRTVGLVREAFVAGSDTIIESMAGGQSQLILLFSSAPFPGYQKELVWDNADSGGNWYHTGDDSMKGWLCPALLKYFDKAPDRIYVQFKVVSDR